MVNGMMNITTRLSGPGAFRLLLALLVVLSHLSRFEIGRPAVFAFFMLSGYWVMRMYDEKYRLNHGVGVFYLSRFLRIWMPFAAAFAIILAIYAALGQSKSPEMWWGFGLLGIATNDMDVVGTAWSLDIELQFYLLVPLLWLAFAPGRSVFFGWGWAGLLGTTALLCILSWRLQLGRDVWTVFSYLPSFLLGALVWRNGLTASGRVASMSVALFVGVGVVVWFWPDARPLLLRDVVSPFHEDWFGMIWTALLLPFIAWNVRRPSGGFDMHMGNYSYALYITHWPVIRLMREFYSPLSTAQSVTLIALIFLISVAFYIVIDRTCEGTRRRIIRATSSGRQVLRPKLDQ